MSLLLFPELTAFWLSHHRFILSVLNFMCIAPRTHYALLYCWLSRAFTQLYVLRFITMLHLPVVHSVSLLQNTPISTYVHLLTHSAIHGSWVVCCWSSYKNFCYAYSCMCTYEHCLLGTCLHVELLGLGLCI